MGALKVIFSPKQSQGRECLTLRPSSLFVREGINEQIWTKFARTEKILIFHLRVAQLVARVQKTHGGRKVLQVRKTRQRCGFFPIFNFMFSGCGTILKTACGQKGIFLRVDSHPGPPRSDSPSE